MIKECQGDIFTSNCQVLVCPVNCVGIMGAGLAKQFAIKFPYIQVPYMQDCQLGRIKIGYPILRPLTVGKMVLFFPTKDHYENPSKYTYISWGLDTFVKSYGNLVSSIAFCLLGCGLGGLEKEKVKVIMYDKLKDLDRLVEVWEYNK